MDGGCDVDICQFLFHILGETPAPKDERKHTTLGKYVTSLEAYEMWKANPAKIKIIDCRIAEEYAFVGHAPMAINIPSMLWTGKWNAEKNDYYLEPNAEFEALVKQKAGYDDTIMIMCHPGIAARLRSTGWQRLDSRMCTILWMVLKGIW